MKSIFLFLLLAVAIALPAQKPVANFSSLNLYRVTGDEGLSQATVNVLFKDSEGFLWIGTDDGLNRYDGKNVQRYYHRFYDTTSIAANEVYGICEDKQGRIWLAHYNAGISCFDKKQNRFYRVNTSPGKLSTNRVYGLHCAPDGTIVARTIEGISFIDPHKFHVRNIDTSTIRDSAIGMNIDIVTADRYYWFGSKTKGLLRVTGNGTIVPLQQWNPAVCGTSVTGIYKVSESELLAASEKGLFRIQKGIADFVIERVLEDSAAFATASKILRFSGSPYIWVATDLQGLFIVDPGSKKIIRRFTSETIRDNLLSNGINYLLQDDEQNVFIGTARGVNVFSPYNNRFNNYENTFRKIPNFGHPVYAVYELDDGNLVIGTKKGGAYYFKVTNLQAQSLPLPHGESRGTIIYHFTPLAARRFLTCTSSGIFELSLQSHRPALFRSHQFPELDALSTIPVTDIHIQNDSIAWIATFTNGLYSWNHKKHTLQQYQKNDTIPGAGPVYNQIQKLVPGKNNTLIICTRYGFSILDLNTRAFFNVPPGNNYPKELPGRNIKYAYDDGARIWIATFGAGLQQFDKRRHTFTGYTTADGLPNDAVYSVIPDHKGQLWIATNNGLSVLDPGTGRIKTYTTADGLPDNEFNGHAAYKSASGKMFYSTLNGIVSVDPAIDITNPYSPNIVLTSFTATDGSRDTSVNTFGSRGVRLPAGYNSLNLRFAALSYAAPHKNRYMVKLEGFDKYWLSLGDVNEIRYPNLPPGHYLFKVRAINNTDNWSKKTLDVRITVSPFWYQTWWFKMAVLIFVLAALLLVIRQYYQYRLGSQQAEYQKLLAVQAERQRISAEIHDDLGAGLSGVRLMTEIIRSKATNPELQQEVDRIYGSVSELSGKMREVIWSLNTENDSLERLLHYLQRQAYQFFEHSLIDVSVNLPDDIPQKIVAGEKRRHIYLALNEAMHNALKHSGATEVSVCFKISGNMLEMRVQDNGTGLKQDSYKNMGNGMLNMQRRMNLISGTMALENGMGVTIAFTIPLN